jgi:hypothetical protein
MDQIAITTGLKACEILHSIGADSLAAAARCDSSARAVLVLGYLILFLFAGGILSAIGEIVRTNRNSN